MARFGAAKGAAKGALVGTGEAATTVSSMLGGLNAGGVETTALLSPGNAWSCSLLDAAAAAAASEDSWRREAKEDAAADMTSCLVNAPLVIALESSSSRLVTLVMA